MVDHSGVKGSCIFKTTCNFTMMVLGQDFKWKVVIGHVFLLPQGNVPSSQHNGPYRPVPAINRSSRCCTAASLKQTLPHERSILALWMSERTLQPFSGPISMSALSRRPLKFCHSIGCDGSVDSILRPLRRLLAERRAMRPHR